jgi:hypothetical protein
MLYNGGPSSFRDGFFLRPYLIILYRIHTTYRNIQSISPYILQSDIRFDTIYLRLKIIVL